MVRVMIVDDHEIVREGLETLLSEEEDMQIVAQAANGEDAVAYAAAHQPDVILMDLVMPEMDGVEAIKRIRASSPESKIIVLTSFGDDQRVYAAIQAGALSYLLKDVLKPDLLRAIRAAAQGKPTLHPEAQHALIRHAAEEPQHARLTERERSVLHLIVQGLSNKEIAVALQLTEGTVKGYVSTILDKLGVGDRTQAAVYALKHGLANGA